MALQSKTVLRRAACEEAFNVILQGFGYDKNEIVSPRRTNNLVVRRRRVAKALREAGFSLLVIAHTMKRDHSSILYLIDTDGYGAKSRENAKAYNQAQRAGGAS